MARSKYVRNYSPQYIEWAGMLEDDPTTKIELNFDDEKQAKAFQLDFICFRAAALHEKMDQGNMYPNIGEIAAERRGCNVIICRKEHTEMAKALRNAVVTTTKSDSE